MSRTGFCLFLVIASSACSAATTRPFVAGPYAMHSAQSFYDDVLEGVRSNGYEPLSHDPERGTIVVDAHTIGSRGQTASFVIQCYEPGWISITPRGAGVRPAGDSLRMSSAMYQEYLVFTTDLMRSLGPVR